MRLYHFSEDPAIERFVPHRAPTSVRDEALVWSIDEWHAPMYYLPRDCPRACFWTGARTTAEDRARWLTDRAALMVIAVESGWLDRIRGTQLYRYLLPGETFAPIDATAGHYVSRAQVEPIAVEPVGDLLAALVDAGAELRVMPRLGPLWQAVVASTLEFSGTRLRNACDWPAGFGALARR